MSLAASFSIHQLAADDVALMEAMLTTFGEAFEDVENYGSARLGSDTWVDNMSAQRAHEALGFEEVDRCVNYRQAIQPEPEAGDPPV